MFSYFSGMLILSQIWLMEAAWRYLLHLRTFLLSGTIRCSGFILHILCPSSGFRHSSKKHFRERRQDGRGVGGHARPLPQTQQKKHIYRINDLHRTATNRWQKNLNSNNGKKFVTLLGRTGEKRRVREGESKWDGRSWKGTALENVIPHPGESPTGGKFRGTGGISRCREECSSKLEY